MVVGSEIFNLLIIVGLTISAAPVVPLALERVPFARDCFFYALSIALLYWALLDHAIATGTLQISANLGRSGAPGWLIDFIAPSGQQLAKQHPKEAKHSYHWADHALFPFLGGGRALRSGSGSWVATSSIRVGERVRKAFHLMRYNPLLNYTNYTKLDAIYGFL